MKVKNFFAGSRGLCPFCSGEIAVPAPPTKAPITEPVAAPVEAKNEPNKGFKPPTDKQLDYARKLGINIPDGVSRTELSKMIDDALDDAPATDGQMEFLRDLGVRIPVNIRSMQMSILLDTALNIRDQVADGIQKKMRESGMLIDSATDLQLLQEFRYRGQSFFNFTLDNDEFRYQADLPISGNFQWNRRPQRGRRAMDFNQPHV